MMIEELEHKKWPKEQNFDDALKALQHESLLIQRSYARQGKRAIILFEGSDAAGKGGNIRRFTEKLDPRAFRVHNISAPDQIEQQTHYMYRFWCKLPPPGRLEIFDRSWYGRVLVERVEGFCSEADWHRAYDEINQFEKMLVDDGVRLVKIFLSITKEEQLSRFKERYENPYKRWKLTVEDFRNREKWDDYIVATNDLLTKCSPASAPWKVIAANSKKAARIEVLQHINSSLSRDVDVAPPPLGAGVQEEWEKISKKIGSDLT